MGEKELNSLLDTMVPEESQAKVETLAAGAGETPPNPDKTAEAWAASLQAKVPWATVSLDQEGFMKEYNEEQRLAILDKFPDMHPYMAQGGPFTTMAWDDYDRLAKATPLVSDVVEGFMGGFNFSKLGNQLSALSDPTKQSDTVQKLLDDAQARDRFIENEKPGVIGRSLYDLSNMAGWLWGSGTQLAGSTAVGAGAGAVFGGGIPGAVAGAGAGFSWGLTTKAAQDNAVQGFLEASTWRTENGEPLSLKSRYAYALFKAGLGAAQANLSVDAVTGKLVDNVAKGFIKSEVGSKFFGKVVLAPLTAGAVGGVVQPVFFASDMLFKNMIFKANDPQYKGMFEDPGKMEQFGNQLLDQAKEGALFFFGAHSIGTGVHGAWDFLWNRKAVDNQNRLKAMDDALEQTNLKKRAPEAIANFVDSMGRARVTVPVDVLGTKAEELFPEKKEEIDAARKMNGGSLSLKLGEWAKLPIEVKDGLRDFIGLNQDPSVHETNENMETVKVLEQSSPHAYTPEDALSLATTADERRVESDVVDKFRNAGMEDIEARITGAIYAQTFNAFNARHMPEVGRFEGYRQVGLGVLESELGDRARDMAGWGGPAGDHAKALQEDSERLFGSIASGLDKPNKFGGTQAEGAWKVLDGNIKGLERNRPESAQLRALRGLHDKLKDAIFAKDQSEIQRTIEQERNALGAILDEYNRHAAGRQLFQSRIRSPAWYRSELERVVEASPIKEAPADEWLKVVEEEQRGAPVPKFGPRIDKETGEVMKHPKTGEPLTNVRIGMEPGPVVRDAKGFPVMQTNVTGHLAAAPLEEMTWRQLDEWLAAQGKTVLTKEDIQEFLRNNPLEAETILHADPGFGLTGPGISVPTERVERRLFPGQDIKGGTNKFELVTRMSDRGLADLEHRLANLDSDQNDLERQIWYYEHAMFTEAGINTPESYLAARSKVMDIANARVKLRSQIETVQGAGHRPTIEAGRHFSDIQNKAGWTRADQRLTQAPEDANPVPTLHIQEQQSDATQDARKFGIITERQQKNKNELTTELHQLETWVDQTKRTWDKRIDAAHDHAFRAAEKGDYDEFDTTQDTITNLRAKKAEAIEEAEDRITAIQRRLENIKQVPEPPFSSHASFVRNSFRQMIQIANASGLTRISWNNGEVMARLNNQIIEHVERLQYNPNNHMLMAFKKDGGPDPATRVRVKPDGLGKYISEELANRLLNQPLSTKKGSKGYHTLEGMDLEFGGEGMKKAYDEIAVNEMNKLLKPYGERVKDLDLLVPEEGTRKWTGTLPTEARLREMADLSHRSWLRSRVVAGAHSVPEQVMKMAIENLSREVRDGATDFDQALVDAAFMADRGSHHGGDTRSALAELLNARAVHEPKAYGQHYFDIPPGMQQLGQQELMRFYQGGESAARGRVTLGAGQRLLELFKGKWDESTALHELAHIYLDMLQQHSRIEGAPATVQEDLKEITNWLGVEHEGQLTDEHHERFATAFERYLAEGGKAESPRLQNIFDHIKDWFMSVYESVARIGEPPSAATKAIFDKMLGLDKKQPEQVNPEHEEIAQDLREKGPDRVQRVLDLLGKGEPERAYLMLNVVTDDMQEIGMDQASAEGLRKAVRDGDTVEAQKFANELKTQLASHGVAEPHVPRERDVDEQLAASMPQGGPDSRVETAPGLVQGALDKVVPEGVQDAVKDSAPVAQEVAAVKAVRRELHLQALFADAKAANMTKPEFKIYAEKAQEVVDEQVKKAVKRANGQLKKRQSEDWKAKEQEVRDAVESDFADKPVNVADKYFQTGTFKGRKVPDDARVKLDPDVITAKFGRKAVDDLPAWAVGKGGVDPDEIAEVFGFRSGKALVNSLRALENDRKDSGLHDEEFAERQIEAEVSQRMEARYGIGEYNPLEETRADIIESTRQSELLADELRYLATLSNTKPAFTAADARAWAIEQFGKQPLDGASDIGKYVRAVGKSGRDAELALLRGDFMKALEAKQRQLLNFHALKVATEFQKTVDRTEAIVKRYGRQVSPKGVHQDFVDQIHLMLQEQGQRIPRTPDNLDRATPVKLDEFINTKVTDWLMPIPPPIYPRSKPMDKFSAEDYSNWAATAQALDKLGKEMGKLYKMHEAADFDNIKQMILENLKGIEKPNFDERSPFHSKFRAGVRSFDSTMTMPERLMQWADRGNPLGPMNSYVFRALLNGVNEKSGLHWTLDFKKEIAQDLKKVPTKGIDWDARVENDILKNPFNDMKPMEFSERALVHLILNMGTESNFAKLVGGYGWDRKEVENFVNANARKEHWEYAKGIWRLLDKLKPLVAEKTEAVTGVAVDLIEGRPIDTPFGRVEGGYYPLTEESISRTNRDKVSSEPLEYRRWNMLPTTQARKQRTGAQYPVDLTGASFASVLEETIHYIGMIEPVIQAKKIISDPEIRTAFSNAFGSAYTKQLNPWLDAIGRNGDMQDYSALEWWMKASMVARANVMAFLVGLNRVTALLHGGGVGFNSLLEIPAKQIGTFFRYMAQTPLSYAYDKAMPEEFQRTWAKLFRNESSYRNMIDEVTQKSGELRNRGLTYADEIGQIWFQQQAGGRLSRFNAAALQFNMSVLRGLDQWSSIATWKAVYEGAKLRGVEEMDARYMADQAVRNAHGSVSQVSKASVQRMGKGAASEVAKWNLMFMGFFVNNYNQLRTTARMAEGKVDTQNLLGTDNQLAKWTTIAARTVVLLGVMGALHQYFRGSQKKNQTPAELAGDMIGSQLVNGMPIIREIGGAILEGKQRDEPISVLISGGLIGHDLLKELEGEKVSDRWVTHALTALGTFPGSPAAGVVTKSETRAAQFLWDVQKGKQNPQDLQEWIRGLETGHTQER